MALSLKNLLESNILPGSEMLTGPQKAESILITGVSVQEFPLDDFIRPGEVVLTTAIGCLEDEIRFCELVQEVSLHRAAALLLSFKDEAYQVPGSVVQTAADNGLPLIRIPWDLRFQDIQTEITRNIDQEYLQHFSGIQASLINLFFEARPLSAAVRFLSGELRSRIIVYDAFQTVLQAFGRGGDPESPEELLPGPEKLIPIHRGSVLVGYLYCGESRRFPFLNDASSALSVMVRGYLCDPLSLWFSSRGIEDITLSRIKNDFIWNLAEKNYDKTEDILRQGYQLGFRLDQPATCILLRAIPQNDEAEDPYTDANIRTAVAIESLIHQLQHDRNLKAMTASRNLDFIMFLHVREKNEAPLVRGLLDALEMRLSEQFSDYRFCFGISDIHTGAEQYHMMYRNAQTALQYCLHQGLTSFYFSDKDSFDADILMALQADDNLKQRALEMLGPLIHEKSRGDMDLIETLTAYLSANFNISETARLLHIHRQSLLYRMEKIENLTGMSLSSHQDLFILETCCRVLTYV